MHRERGGVLKDRGRSTSGPDLEEVESETTAASKLPRKRRGRRKGGGKRGLPRWKLLRLWFDSMREGTEKALVMSIWQTEKEELLQALQNSERSSLWMERGGVRKEKEVHSMSGGGEGELLLSLSGEKRRKEGTGRRLLLRKKKRGDEKNAGTLRSDGGLRGFIGEGKQLLPLNSQEGGGRGKESNFPIWTFD